MPVGEGLGSRAAGLLVDEADGAYAQGRYRHAVAAASRAVDAAGQLDDPVLLVRALRIEASALRMLGDSAAALARYTRILGLAEDPATAGRLDHPDAARAVARAYWGWVDCAQYLTSIPVRELFRVLDAADRWLTAAGHRDWRASILLERALVHARLREMDAAVAAAEEALAVAVQHPHAPGFTLGSFRFQLGDILRAAGRAAEAAPLYQAVLADPDSPSWDRYVAHEGLARCALAAGDLDAARREARTAVALAEQLGDVALCVSLEALAEVCRAAGDLDAAWQVATRYLEAAGRVGGHERPFFAARVAADIALDRADLAAARQLISELDEHAAARDAAAGTDTRVGEAVERRQRLATLEETAP
jgi:tetratricopeptide (TPR) repeat protein